MLILIWAQDENGVIGLNNTLPWHVPTDFKHFKEKTMDHTILFGRKTFDGMKQRLLPGRQTIIFTRNRDYHSDGVVVVHTKEEVLELAKTQDIYICGGREIYQLFLPEADLLELTIFHETFVGDTFFPEVSFEKFEKITEEKFSDEKSKITGTFFTYQKKIS
ncbi:dihydrofolate reductase [Enterococcus timonensis]|uniref:dihydrofolate reductase n=1 Tax=Enterococcus timonensis TaxID=1852364 RepID=UPI0008D95650|nr:dihydrofolate reductase [Enterococcus timonensis]